MAKPPCDDASACITYRRKSMRYLPGDPRNWDSHCANCKVGRERQMANWTAEPDPVDDTTKVKTPFRIEPMPCVICGTIVRKPSYRTRAVCKPCYFAEKKAKAAKEREKHKCEQCGKPRTKYAKLCNACYKANRRVPEVCMEKGCERRARRKGLCDAHYYRLVAPEEKARKKKANAEAVKKYREVNHRIAQMRMAKPKDRMTPVRRVPE